MTQQDIHPDPTRTRPDQGATEQATDHTSEHTSAQTPEQTSSHQWLGQSEHRSPSSTPTTGIPTTTAHPDWYGTPATGGYPTYPPITPTPTPAPKAKPGRGLGQITAVAILAAALASGGTYAATRYATPAPSSSPAATTQSNGSTSPQVIQGNAAAP
jgi:putative serine protease PepD